MSRNNWCALVTGANRGIGLEITKQLLSSGIKVIATARAIENFPFDQIDNTYKSNIQVLPLDLTDDVSIEQLCFELDKNNIDISILVNNAAVYLDDPRKKPYQSVTDINISKLEQTIAVNLMGSSKLIWKFLPQMKQRNYGRIVNISSGMARIDDLDTQGPFYRISKTALNALTKIVASECMDFNISVSSVCPGWVKTDMGGENAPITPEKAAEDIVWLCLKEDNHTNGKFFRNKKELDWAKK